IKKINSGVPIEDWRSIFGSLPVGRCCKPRKDGITMVIDRVFGSTDLRIFLESAHHYVDFLKIGFGTALLYDRATLLQKLEIARSFSVETYLGGTLFEIAYLNGTWREYLSKLKDLGF